MSVKQAIVLAAGKSSRFWPLGYHEHKCMYRILGKPLLQYTLEGLKKSGIKEVIIIHSPVKDSIKKYFGNGKKFGLKIKYGVQEKPLGMGNALSKVEKHLKDNFIVLGGNKANCYEIIKPMLRLHKKKFNVVLASQKTSTPWVYGILDIKGNLVRKIVEKPKKGKEPSKQKVIAVYLLSRKFLSYLKKVKQTEYSFEQALNNFMKEENKAGVVKLKSIHPMTLKYPWHLFEINNYFMKKIKRKISKKAKIHSSAKIEGNVVIEDNVKVMENAIIKGPCYISKGCIIGNNALVREKSYLGKGVVVGFQTEIKNSIIYDNVKFHKNFFGDSIIDSGCRFGAGTITANRRLDRKSIKSMVKGEKVDTGLSFFGTVCGKKVKIGINSSIMPGVKLGSNAVVGSNTQLMGDVEDNTTVYAKFKSLVKKRC